MAKTPHEHRLLHPRVAYVLERNNWAYIHEYHARRGFFDFLAIHREAHVLAIVECKCAITNVGDLIYQMKEYHETLRIKAAVKVVFTLKPPTDNAMQRLKAANIRVYGVSLDDPCVSKYPKGQEKQELTTLMKLHHVVEPEPAYEDHPLPPLRIPQTLPFRHVPAKPTWMDAND